MGRPSKNAFHGGGRPVDMSKTLQANVQPKGIMTPETYQAMKAEKRNRIHQKRAQNSARKTGKSKK